jgi:hypothetical protein
MVFSPQLVVNYDYNTQPLTSMGDSRMNLRHILFTTLLSLSLAPYFQTARAVTFPLSASENRNYLVDAQGVPFYIHGDTRWQLLENSIANLNIYFNNRADKKFNTTMADLIGYESFMSNARGEKPFNNNNVSTPNENYFKYAEEVFNLAKDKGFIVVLYVSINLLGDENSCRRFGQYLGNRFKNQPNLFFSIGYGDHGLNEWRNRIQAMSEGLLQNKPGTFITSHGSPGQSSRDYLGSASYHTLNGLYCYYPTFQHGPNHHVYGDLYDEAFKSPDMPTYVLESKYEGGDNGHPHMVRRQGWWALLSGAAGHMYGHEKVYGHKGGHTQDYEAEGAKDMRHLKDFVDSIDWHNLSPDRNNSVVTSGYGNKNLGTGGGGDDYITTAITNDSRRVVSYVPPTGTGTRSFTVNMSRLSGPATARWYNPSDGQYTTVSGSPFPNGGNRSFTTPGNNGAGQNDWVLVLESGSGSVTNPTPTPTPTPVQGPKVRANGNASIAVDGNLTEAEWSEFTQAAKSVSGTQNTVSFAVSWNSTHLYVGVRVLDSVLYNDSANIWDDDSVEIYIDAENNKNNSFDASDRQLIKGYNDSDLFEKNNNKNGVLHAVSAITGGYSVELAIPWSNLGLTPRVDLALGFDVGVNDDDNGGDSREGQQVWVGTGDNWFDTSGYGSCVLGGQSDSELSFTIPLRKDWNLISLPIQPSKNRIEDVLAGIKGNVLVVHAWNGKSYESYYADGQSDLSVLQAGRGYWILMENNASLIIRGKSTNGSIELKEGWNLVGFNSTRSVPVSEALTSTKGLVLQIYAFDAASNQYEEVKTLEPGRGYWFYSEGPVSWKLPSK